MRCSSGLERWTGDRMVQFSNSIAENRFASELWQFRLPCFASVFQTKFRGDTKSRRSLLSGVSARGASMVVNSNIVLYLERIN